MPEMCVLLKGLSHSPKLLAPARYDRNFLEERKKRQYAVLCSDQFAVTHDPLMRRISLIAMTFARNARAASRSPSIRAVW